MTAMPIFTDPQGNIQNARAVVLVDINGDPITSLGGGGSGGDVTIIGPLNTRAAAQGLSSALSTEDRALLTDLATKIQLLVDQGTASGSVEVVSTAGEAHMGSVGGTTPRITGSKATPSSNSAYAPGDHIANSATGASVTPITFSNAARLAGGSARISGVRCVVSCASGTIGLPQFLLYLFRPATNIPFAAGSYPADNTALNISNAAMKELVGVFEFLSTDWLNQAGLATALGDTLYQGAPIRPLPSGRARPYAPFNLSSISGSDLLGVMQAQNAWNPGNVVNTFDFALDLDQD